MYEKCLLTYYVNRDHVPAILLGSWLLEAALWDGDVIAGPVPTIFAEDPTKAMHVLLANTRLLAQKEIAIFPCNCRAQTLV